MADELAMEESTDILGVTSDSEYSDTNKDSAGLKRTPPDETEVLARPAPLTPLLASWMLLAGLVGAPLGTIDPCWSSPTCSPKAVPYLERVHMYDVLRLQSFSTSGFSETKRSYRLKLGYYGRN